MTTRPLALTAGEPAGIGPELCLAVASTPLAERLVVIADPAVLENRAAKVGVTADLIEVDATTFDAPVPAGALRVYPTPMPRPDVCGTPSIDNAAALLEGLKFAISGCREKRFAGLVTAPVQKSVINDAGIPFSGHTEFIAQMTGTPMPVMLLVAASLRVALATTHLPLAAVPAAITPERLHAVLEVLHADLRQRFNIADPAIIVCGLNPHAGEGGHLGHEDDEIIRPVIARCRERGMNVRGPMPADTAFTPSAGDSDAVLAMYHDQGLPVLKYAGFGNAVNVTLGLPIVRTSVDHGTALDIAGQGTADSGSLITAIELALALTAP